MRTPDGRGSPYLMNPQGSKKNRDYQERSTLAFHTHSSAWGSHGNRNSPKLTHGAPRRVAPGWKQNIHAVTLLKLHPLELGFLAGPHDQEGLVCKGDLPFFFFAPLETMAMASFAFVNDPANLCWTFSA